VKNGICWQINATESVSKLLEIKEVHNFNQVFQAELVVYNSIQSGITLVSYIKSKIESLMLDYGDFSRVTALPI
jgi:hypothetical protein